MNKRYCLNEDKQPSKLRIIWSSKLLNEIASIIEYNHGAPNRIRQWRDYLDGIANYVSNPAIAFDYMDRYTRFPNGARFIRDFDYDVAYSIIDDNSTRQQCVYIFIANLSPEEFGLKVPSVTNEAKQRIEAIRKAVMPILEFNQRLSAIR